ncbi:alkaline phosphatase PhoX [Paraglaciecola sp. L3A3]|uniref:alkaline phosphatase PhoX n=1 Tax=Paraglaciecola sp. L3A3 TaxID=2686358 RepID=UPI00131B34DC|nr:alkaline phosphatase PhoX [Paraglaciecola sp. L3A3]
MVTRRQFTIGVGALAFGGLSASFLGKVQANVNVKTVTGYGPLISDPNKILDLPAGFSYQVISQLDNKMSDGFTVPDKADGMGCLPLDDDRVVLVRNHELKPSDLAKAAKALKNHKTALAYDHDSAGVALPGGTSNLVYNLKTKKLEQEFLSLVGTIRNCAGGITPWNTWLTCEESVSRVQDGFTRDHGYIFEVPAAATGLINPVPLKEMGRFNHEAAAVDPNTGIVYLTEDRGDSLFYRFIPKVKGELHQGGQLQALVVQNKPSYDSRNWSANTMQVQQWHNALWINLSNPESPEDDLRKQGYTNGAAVFARGEGIHWGENELYFCCTNGGAKKLGQVMRYQPSKYEGQDGEIHTPGRLQLFLESADKSLYNFGDNLTVTPAGHLIVCEDQYTAIVDNYLRGVTPEGELYNFARLTMQTELAGACFSPDGSTMFVNVYSPTKTLAITGPWNKFSG